MDTSSPAHRWLVAVLRVALICALVGAGWLVYRRLPHDDSTRLGTAGLARETLLRIVLRRTVEEGMPTADVIPVQLYSIDVAAAQREFFDERRPGMRFEDFMVRRMGARPPVKTQLDANGETIVSVPPGRWWVHATLAGAQETTWRLPVNVAGREQTVELTTANAYMRTKRF
ncbi:MAG TPA: hypothetical protein VJT82_09230 [Pyrinomonadaceae bacterium]|nr:hypothetical protein [Pyrinomonadaceae bacterium]